MQLENCNCIVNSCPDSWEHVGTGYVHQIVK